MITTSADFIRNVYAPIRQFDAKMKFSMNSVTTTYDDDTIIDISVIEEVSPFNETLPSNEVKITMDNSGGQFDFLNFQNMVEILANKPLLNVEFGLVFGEYSNESITSNFVDKVAGSVIDNPHVAKRVGNQTTLQTPSGVWVELVNDNSAVGYGSLTTLNNASVYQSANLNGTIAQKLFSFNIIAELEKKFGINVWQGKTTIAEKVVIAKGLVSKLTCNWHGFGSSPNGNKANLSRWTPSSLVWQANSSHINSTITKLSTSGSSNHGNYIDDNGFFHVLAHAEPSNGTIASTINTDYVELIIETNPVTVVEWIPMGEFYLNSWENNRSTKTVSLIGRDTFGILNELDYTDTGKANLYDLAVDVFAQSGVTRYSIDNSLKTITTTGFSEKIGSKQALQYIAIASTCVVYQDRLGVVHIKLFTSLDLSSNFLTYAGQTGLYAGSLSYPLVSTGSGMRRMDLDNMYDKPKLSLERSINAITMKVYQGVEPHELTINNITLSGTNGVAFAIDNPLIHSDDQASKVAQWIMRESTYNVMYNTDWRGNPALECVDIVLIEEGTNADKQSRIYRQEFFYEGYLMGVTDSRGGI